MKRLLLAGVALTSVGLVSIEARAATVLPVTDLSFNVFSLTFTAPKTLFTTAAPTGYFRLVRRRSSTTSSVSAIKAPRPVAPAFMLFMVALASRILFRLEPISIRRTAIRSSRARFSRPLRGCRSARRIPFSSSRQPVNKLDSAAPPPSSGGCFLAWVGSVPAARPAPPLSARLPAPATMWRWIRR